MDVVHRIDDATDVVQILQLRLAVLALRVDHVDRGAGGTEIDFLAPGLEVETGILSVEREVARRLGNGVLDEGLRKQ